MTKQTDTYKHTPAGEYYREGPHGQGENGTPSDENQPSKPSRRQSFKEVYDKLKKEGEIDIEAFVEKANTLDLNPVQTKKDERWMNAEVKWTADRVKEEIRLIEKNQESHPRKKRKKTFKAVYNKFKKKGEFDIKVLVEEANRLDLNPVKTEKDERWVNAEAKWTVDRVREEIRLIEKENAENEENTSSNETASSKPERYTFKPIKMTVTTDRDNKDLRVAPQNLTAPSKKVPSASRPAPVAPASGGNPPPNDNNNNDLPMDSSTQPTKPVNGLKTSGTKKTSYIYVSPKLTAPSRRFNADEYSLATSEPRKKKQDLHYVPPKLTVPSEKNNDNGSVRVPQELGGPSITPPTPPVPPIPPIPPMEASVPEEGTLPISEPEKKIEPTSKKKKSKIKDRIKGNKEAVRRNLRKFIRRFLIIGGILTGVVGSYFLGLKSAQNGNQDQGENDKSPDIVKVEGRKQAPSPYKTYEAPMPDAPSGHITTINVENNIRNQTFNNSNVVFTDKIAMPEGSNVSQESEKSPSAGMPSADAPSRGGNVSGDRESYHQRSDNKIVHVVEYRERDKNGNTVDRQQRELIDKDGNVTIRGRVERVRFNNPRNQGR